MEPKHKLIVFFNLIFLKSFPRINSIKTLNFNRVNSISKVRLTNSILISLKNDYTCHHFYLHSFHNVIRSACCIHFARSIPCDVTDFNTIYN